MSSSLFVLLFLLGILMMASGLLYQLVTGGVSNIGANAASSFALLVIFCFLLLNTNSFDDLIPIFEGICGGVPFVSGLTDFGSLQSFFTRAPLEAVLSFFDVVILSALIEVMQQLFSATGSYARKGAFAWINLFTGIISALLSLAILNYIIKTTPFYAAFASIIGTALSATSLSSIIVILISFFLRQKRSNNILYQSLLAFSKTSVGKVIVSSFLKAVLYVIGIWIMENFFPEIQTQVSSLIAIFTAFVPCLILLFGICLILKSVFR